LPDHGWWWYGGELFSVSLSSLLTSMELIASIREYNKVSHMKPRQ
jgi:hypothetical protein